MSLPAPRYDHTLITGASAGLGRLFAERLAPRARLLTLTARRDDRLRALAADLEARHPGLRCRVVALDLGEPGAATRLAAAVREGGAPAVDLLVNNAGFGRHGGFDQFPWDDWRRMIDLNVMAPTELLHAVWDDLRAVPGRGVINVASAAGFQPVPWFAVYSATKAYVRSLSNALAREARGHGTRVLSLCPGSTATEFHDVAQLETVYTKARMPAAEVVDAGLAAYEKGKRELVTGWRNRLVAVVAARVPLGLVLTLAGRYGARRAPHAGGTARSL